MRGATSALSRVMADLGIVGSLTLPSNRFFTPTDAFWQMMEQHRDKVIVDMGCGRGDLVREGRERGFRITGCDIAPREGYDPSLIHMFDAMRFPVSDKIVALICRPNHNGWCEEALWNAIDHGATVYYIGLERNLEEDVSDELLDHDSFNDEIPAVGEEGENAWRWVP